MSLSARPLSDETHAAAANVGHGMARRRAGHDPVGWLASFVSFTILEIVAWSATIPGQRKTTVLLVLFLRPWAWIVVRQPSTALRSLVANWPLLALPAWAVFSVVWSDYPFASLKEGAEFLATIVVGIWAGRCIRPWILISALFSASLMTAVLGFVLITIDHGRANYVGGFIDLFGSKNFFALYVACLLLMAFAVILDPYQARAFRGLGLAGALLGPPLLVYAHSLDALFGAGAAIAIISLLWLARRLSPAPRLLVYAVTNLVLLFIPILGSLEFSLANFLAYFGKNITLTGRTELWHFARIAISQRPILGVGYEAYWQPGNWRADQLWQLEGLHGTSGYHFHNTYLQVTVDLGYVGLALLLLPFAIIFGRMIANLFFLRLGADQMFAISIFVFLILRTPLEVDLLFPFQLPSILICLSYVYLRQQT